MAFRFDTIRIDRTERTPGSAGLRVPAVLTRPGVFTYEDQAGKQIREYRPPEEVAKADSLATYEDAHVTIGHPPMGVSPASYKDLNVGHVRAGTVKADDKSMVHASLFVGRGDAIQRIDAKDLHDISCGYAVRLDETPGVTPAGAPYDRVQRDIVINHVALLPRGDGRLGTQCALRLDSTGEQIRTDATIAPAPAPSPKTDPKTMIKITRADGSTVEVEAGSADHVKALEENAKAEKARADAVQARLDEQSARQARAELEGKAAKAGVSCTRKDGDKDVALTDLEVKTAIVKKTDGAFDPAGKSVEYINARVDGALAIIAAAPVATQDASAAVRAALAGGTGGPATRQDAIRLDGPVPVIENDPRAYALRADAYAATLARRKI